jgi:hypothetical protein
LPLSEPALHAANVAARPIDAPANRAQPQGTCEAARRRRHAGGVVFLGGFKRRVVDKAAGERRVLPVDAEHVAKLACVAVEIAPGKEQDRYHFAGKQPKLAILGEQNPLLPGAALDKLAVAPASLRQNTVIAGRTEPPDEPAQHCVAEKSHRAAFGICNRILQD